MKQSSLLQSCTRCMIVLSVFLFSCDKKDDPKPTPVVPTVSITTATALPSTTVYGGKSKITIIAQNATSIEVLEDGKVIKAGNSHIEFETDQLFETTKYTVVAKNGSQTKTADLTIAVAEPHPQLKLLLDGRWQLVKEFKMAKWNGETQYTAYSPVACEADNVYTFTFTTATANWGASYCSDIEKTTTKLYFGGFDPVAMKLVWLQPDPWDVLEITETTLKIHTLIPRFDDFTILTDYIKEYKNIAK